MFSIQILKESPPVPVQQQRRGAGYRDHQRADRFSSRERRWLDQLCERDDPDEQHAEDTFAVEVAPHRDHRHAPPQRPGRAAGQRSLDEPRARRDRCKRDQVRTRHRARFDHEEPQNQDRQRRQRARVHAATEVDERERRRDRDRLQRLNRSVAAHAPRGIRARFGKPGSVVLPVVGVSEAEDVGCERAAPRSSRGRAPDATRGPARKPTGSSRAPRPPQWPLLSGACR